MSNSYLEEQPTSIWGIPAEACSTQNAGEFDGDVHHHGIPIC